MNYTDPRYNDAMVNGASDAGGRRRAAPASVINAARRDASRGPQA